MRKISPQDLSRTSGMGTTKPAPALISMSRTVVLMHRLEACATFSSTH
jgi:hypothetical protein